jgi:hypothetical protein
VEDSDSQKTHAENDSLTLTVEVVAAAADAVAEEVVLVVEQWVNCCIYSYTHRPAVEGWGVDWNMDKDVAKAVAVAEEGTVDFVPFFPLKVDFVK